MASDEEVDIIEECLKLAPEPYKSIIRSRQEKGWFGTILNEFQGRYTLNEDQLDTVTIIAFRAACDPDTLDSMKDTLIAEADVSYEHAVKLQRDITKEIIIPIKEEGDRLLNTQRPSAPRVGQTESKIFESGGYVVTTERLVYSDKVVRLDDIQGGAVAFVDRGFLGTAVIAGIGLLMLLFGGAFFKIVGLAVLAAAYFFFTSTIQRTVVLSLKSGEGLTLKVSTTELVHQLAAAINDGIRAVKSSRAGALRDELSRLPNA